MQILKLKFILIFRLITLALVLSVVFSQIFTNEAQAALGINRQINFQGKLVNNPASTNVTNTNYTVIFTFYDRETGGTVLWQETQTVSTTDGIFRVALGSVTPFPTNFNFNWSGLYLGIKVNSDSEMTPRIQMAAVPFAFNSEKVAGLTVQDTSGNASTSGTLQIANAKTINLGTQNLTFTTTADTAITLPTTGTLLTNTASANQTITSTQTTGNILSLSDSTGLTSGITGLTVGLTSSTNSQNKTGISFDLSGGSGGTYYDLLGTGSTWSITRGGVLTVSSCSGCGSASGVNWWNQLTGALSPIDTSNDFLLGSTSTLSALFSYTGIKTGQTIASSSGNLIVMANNGWGGKVGIATNNPVSVLDVQGGSANWSETTPGLTTGSLHLDPGSTTDNFGSAITFGASDSSNGETAQAGIYVRTDAGYGSKMYFATSNNYTTGAQVHLSIDEGGNVQTTSASDLYLGINRQGGKYAALQAGTSGSSFAFDVTGNFYIHAASALNDYTIDTTHNVTFTGAGSYGFLGINEINPDALLDVNGTGNVQFNNTGSFVINTTTPTITTGTNQNLIISPNGSGRVGINTTSPLATFDVRGNSVTGGTIPVASVSSTTSFASLVTNNDGLGDLFTASKSGKSIFTVRNNGQVTLGAPYYTAGCTALETNSVGTLVCGTDDSGTGGGYSPFQETLGAIMPNNSTVDFLVGGQSTTSALFAIKGVVAGTPIATLSATTNGNGIVLSGSTSTIQSLKNNALILGGDTTGDIQLKPGTGMVFIGDNEVKSGGLTFYSSGVGETDASIITDATGNLIFSAPTGTVEVGSGTGNISLEGDADTSIVASFIGIPAADMFQITNTGQAITANGIDGLALAYVLGGSSAVTNAGFTVDLTTTNNNASTVLRGINIGNITGQASATEVGLRIGTGWDSGISVESGGITIATGALAVNSDSITADGATLTINAGGAVDIQDGLTVDSLTIDTGDITWSGATPTITINAAETFTISNGTAADNFVYNTSSNALTIGDGTNGLTFDIDTGILYQGSGRKTKTITLSPEYAGAIISASGSATTNGSMTSDASPSANFRTYYEWTSTQTSLQDYTIAIRVTLPSDFSTWTTSSTTMQVNFNTGDTSALANKLDVFVYNPSTSTSTPVVYRQARVSGTDKTWTTVDIANTDLEDSPAWNTAGQTAIIYLKVYGSGTYNYTQVGDITLSYLSAF